jgi:hypothetical protein
VSAVNDEYPGGCSGDYDLQLHCRLGQFGTRRCQAPALRRARHPERGGCTAPQALRRGDQMGRVGIDPRSVFPWHGRSPVSTLREWGGRSGPSCVLPKGVPQGRTESGGIVLAAICWAASAQRRCHPQEALYLPTFSHLFDCQQASLSLSLSSLSLSALRERGVE